MRTTTRVFAAAAVAAVSTGVWAAPSGAVVHEIVGQWCAGHGALEPPGVSDPTQSNFARPVNANGFVGDAVFDATLGGLLVTFDYDHPASKVQGSGDFIQVGTTPDGTAIFIELVEPDPDFPAFQHCPRLAAP